MAQMSDLFLLNPKSEIDDNTEIGFIPMACVDDGFSGKHSFEIRNWGDVKKGYCHFQDGDIGVAKISPCFENLKSCILQSLPNGVGTGTTELVILRSLGVYAPFYLYLFKSSWYISQGTKYFKGVVGQQRVNKAIFTELEVPLPSVAEQERIVAEIKRWFGLFDLIEKAKFNLANNIKLAKSKVLDLAIHGKLVPQDPTDEPAAKPLKRINPNAEITSDNGHYQKLPKGWCLCLLNDVLKEVFAGGDKPLIFSKNKSEENYIPIYANGTENKGLFGFTNKAQVYERCLTISARGTIGFTCIREVPFVPIVRLITAIPLPVINLLFLKHQIDTMLSYTEGSSIPQLTIPTIKRMPIILPPLKEQLRIVAKIEELFTLLDTIKAQL